MLAFTTCLALKQLFAAERRGLPDTCGITLAVLKKLDDFRFKHRFESRTDAIKWLLDWALNQKPVPKGDK
jgi:hypothetical protein